ncbi:tryptophan 2,3-dioxygenase [Sphingosinicella sp. CPCC 101087]|uniref:tryptophan 2,3-dioxygenase n=1 Tax=Sphingosinicella sp. CPCC 101087 TaxID=2497754 RepID=UPI00101D38DF|nr:tryptophan 2,3-dioxygenase family protein [Sphingosinicella sp. CPCC 101087]
MSSVSEEIGRNGPSVTYDSYLLIAELTACQQPLSAEHDEMLFIIIHQASELWLKLCLHELSGARDLLREDALDPALKMLARVTRAQMQMIQSWDALATMTPSDYHRFRPFLGSSSGFQSGQYRLLEFILGARSRRMIEAQPNEALARRLEQELTRPSLYDEVLHLLFRRGFGVPRDRLDRDPGADYHPSTEVESCWLEVYERPEAHWSLYELAEKLVDIENDLQRWRFAHLKSVERIIGFKKGTGGTSGVAYLENVLKQRFFPELLSVRTRVQ